MSEQDKFTKHAKATHTSDIVLSNNMVAHEIKMLCVQQGFPSKPQASYSLL